MKQKENKNSVISLGSLESKLFLEGKFFGGKQQSHFRYFCARRKCCLVSLICAVPGCLHCNYNYTLSAITF